MSWSVREGDCLEVLSGLEDESIDAIVCDPPAGIGFMGKHWDRLDGFRRSRNPNDVERPSVHGRLSRSSPEYGLASDEWITWLSAVMAECLRVARPGAHALVWALPRTSHWTGLAIESAGWEVRDRISHLFATGFPKSLDVSKAIDKAAGAEREVVGTYESPEGTTGPNSAGMGFSGGSAESLADRTQTAPATPEAARWEGFGTALKPACEDWWLARKPLDGTVAANVLEHGTGGLNIDAGRIGTAGESWDGQELPDAEPGTALNGSVSGALNSSSSSSHPQGRWPTNVALSHSPDCELIGERKDEDGTETIAEYRCAPGCPVAELDRQSGERKAGGNLTGSEPSRPAKNTYGEYRDRREHESYGDTGGASRFFFQAKPSRAERNAGCEDVEKKPLNWSSGEQNPDSFQAEGTEKAARNPHPTVKSINLMRWLVRLVTPPGGRVLDCFAGSGTTGIAAVLEGFDFIGIEREPEYAEIARARIAWWEPHAGLDTAEILRRAGLSKRAEAEHREAGQMELSPDA